jgi:hypothetical protein
MHVASIYAQRLVTLNAGAGDLLGFVGGIVEDLDLE